MSGCAHIVGSLHITIKMAMLIETLKSLSSDLCWCSCNIFYTSVDVITHDESVALFSVKGESLQDYWDCILNDLIQPEDDDKGYIPDLIVDDGDEMTIIIHEGKKTNEFFLKDDTIPEPISTYNIEFKIFQTIIKRQLEGVDIYQWNKNVNTCMQFSEKTFTGVHHLYIIEKTGTNHQE